MSFLYPLFLAGLAAVGIPILLHLIRRYTRQRVSFSSLMFLKPSPPRLKRRSRLEHIPLLLLRCLIVCLLALAFARPFLVTTSGESETLSGRRIVLLMDTSASMQRTGLWDQALNQIRSKLETLSPLDRVCLISFDKTPRILMSFASWAALASDQRRSALIEEIDALSPTWQRTDLGQALITAVETLEDDDVYDASQMTTSRTVILISDLQEGCDIKALQTYEWPANIQLQAKPLQATGSTNASLQLMTDDAGDSNDIGIRLTNTEESTRDLFKITWTDKNENGTDVYVPAGHVSVISVPYRESAQGQRLVLSGDDDDFDNTLYVAPQAASMVRVMVLGQNEPNNPDNMLYYLLRALKSDTSRSFRIDAHNGDESVPQAEFETAQVFVVTDAISAVNLDRLQHALTTGRMVLLPLTSADNTDTLVRLTGVKAPVRVREAEVDGYAMLSRLDFEHPILTSFADPKFGDFTHVHVWQYRRIDPTDLPKAQVPIWLDTEDPAWMTQQIGDGTLVVMTFGWQPKDSDLALSSKFVPLLSAVLEYGGAVTSRVSQYFVGDTIPIQMKGINRRMHTPKGETVVLKPEQDVFVQTDQPGLYTLETQSGSRVFSVNVPASECRTTPMPIETLEQLGVTVGTNTNLATASLQQKKSDINAIDLEFEQKFWRKCMLALLAAMLIEIWLGGWLTRTNVAESSVGSVVQGEAQ